MDTRKKILAVAIIAALVGGVVGAFAFRAPGSNTEAAMAARSWDTPSSAAATDVDAEIVADMGKVGSDQTDPAYRDGFNEGYATALENGSEVTNRRSNVASNRVNQITRQRYAHNTSNSTSSQNNYVEPRKRSFWDKHRDKLTVAMGAGGGAIIGGLIGGKKGAGIGALAGGGGSALYTYKLRKKNRRY